jgi:hypothetical protein
MIYDILKHYLHPEERRKRFIPLKVDVRSPDYYLYLYASNDAWFVLVDVDYPSLSEVTSDIEDSFPVHVVGWRTLIDYRLKIDDKLLQPTVFSTEQTKGANYYHAAFYDERGTKYALLQVEPNDGIDFDSFGLKFYKTA